MKIEVEVPDTWKPGTKFASHEVMACGKDGCNYHTLSVRLLVEHLFAHTESEKKEYATA